MTWLPNVSGRPIELVWPIAEQVDFAAMAYALSHTNRFAGHAQMPVSVGLHTLIGLDLAPDALKPWWLLHDAHEERTGEVTSPAKASLGMIALEMFGETGARIVADVRQEFERRHDAIIHTAAGLPLPSAEQCRLIKQVDLAALVVERRHFIASGSREWAPEIEAVDRQLTARAPRWMPPGKVADALIAAFRQWLPALRHDHAAPGQPASRLTKPAA